MKLSQEVLAYINQLTIEKYYKGFELQIDKLLKDQDLQFFAANFKDNKLSGCIFQDQETSKFRIYVNSSHPMTRKRFTAIHELGHYISAECGSYSQEQLFKGGGFEDYAISYRKEDNFNDAEREANEIAARLLMPDESVEKLLNQGLSIEEMADKFFVSQQAMSIRLDRLGVFVL